MRLSHEPYYQDRRSVADLCYDFPADEPLIEGLHGMQCYLWNRGQNIDIPVLRVMNTAHYLASYMFHTECSGDQMEYDVMAYMSMGRDRLLTSITLITLAAMLDRTEGMRARHCRSILLEDRSEDFYEGVSLFERFLHSAERRFAEQDFMTDVMAELTDFRQQAQQLINDKLQLQKQIKEMENQQKYIGYNVENMTINMSGGTLVQHADLVQASGEVKVEQSRVIPTAPATGQPHPAADNNNELFCRITQKAYDMQQAQAVEHELRSAAISAPKLVRAIRTNEALGYLDTKNLSSTDLYNLLNEHFGLTFKQRNFAKYRAK